MAKPGSTKETRKRAHAASAPQPKVPVIERMSESSFEAETIRLALSGDPDAGRLALDLCRAGLDTGKLSAALAAYLADRLWAIEAALAEADRLRGIKQSSGSIRSARDAAIAEALCIKRPASKPSDPLPDWQEPYAALGTLLLRAGIRPERVHATLSDARSRVEGVELDRRTSQRILEAYRPMLAFDTEMLLHLTGPLRALVPTYLPQTSR